jgi:hypothetical protein
VSTKSAVVAVQAEGSTENMLQSGGYGMGEGRECAQDMKFYFEIMFIDFSVRLAYLGT